MPIASTVIVMPASPALVAQLAPRDSASADLLAAVRAAFLEVTKAQVPKRISICRSSAHAEKTTHRGSFRAWGSPQTCVSDGEYLEELLVRYAIEHDQLLDEKLHGVAVSMGSQLELQSNVVNVVMAEGPAGLSPRAPLAFIPRAADRHRWCELELQGGSAEPTVVSEDELRADGIVDPEAWVTLLSCSKSSARLIESRIEHGVGRYVALWQEVTP